MADKDFGDISAPLVDAIEVTPVSGSIVEVVAPLNLKEGYELKILVNGQQKSVRVPPGGVTKGDTFQAIPFDSATGTTHHIPVGQWRDGLCDCFRFGICHSVCCMGYWCEPVLAGQMMTRMSRSWFFAGRGNRPSASNTCQIVTGIWLVVLVIQGIMQIVMDTQACIGGRLDYDIDTMSSVIRCPDGSIQTPNATYTALSAIGGTIGGLFAIYMFLSICRTRAAMREKFQIQPGTCGAFEDCCCAFWCSCCTVQQMARHTNDYSTHDVPCCSNECFNNRGQQEQLPEIETFVV